MFKTSMTMSQPAGITMPMPIDTHIPVMSVRAFPVTTGVVCLPAAGVQSTRVRGYRVLDAAVVKGAFPGTSAWSPPI
jgi:hypothetical protein